ncbi:trypsin-like serine peptidase [Pseudonocardia parietis]|uniref:V8-like Glu-specific endopeptidase n=1 Tax=Pseudonocardia parietis TaxID=570936 RepID=A0ABS4W776_9PSEU|nr:trypsin-like peptidase domain-containing protein [Pseudonocardia parietis]MBP2371973.1 V8-like Glu-specific endopeptidase [Pseudonocardia parietis]
MTIRRVGTVPVAAVVAAALACVLLVSDSPPGAGVVGLGSAATWGAADPTPPHDDGPPVRGQAGPIVGGLSASSVGVLVVDGGRHQCSAAVVASRSRRLLATAAHCVWLDGAWRVDGAMFIPGWASGEQPYGRWAVDTAYLPPAWQQANSPITDVAADTDFAFVSLLPCDGRLPEQVLGAQGIRFSTGEQLEVAALGYPALGSYDGQSLRGCVGDAAVEDFARDPDQPAGQVLALDCDMTEGASGGPWLTGPDAAAGRGQIVGVVSGGDDTALVSPVFGPAARQIYDAADSASLLTAPESSAP